MLPLPQSLTWLFLDLNSYFASVEQQEYPELRGRPVAVVPMETEGTCAIAASYEAKLYGVKTGTKIYEARKMCPGLITVPARHEVYTRYHHRILEEVIKHTPINKVWSVDELSSKLPPGKRNIKSAMQVAENIKQGLRRNVGEQITCSIGLAPNGFLAKVATDMEKPDGLVILEPDKLPGPLFDLKLTDLPGINVNMERRLNRAGITTIEHFWNAAPKQIRKIWGGVGGERFWYNLRGHEIPDIPTSKSVIGHSRVLDTNLRDPENTRLMGRRLTVKATTRLRRYELFAQSFSLGVRCVDGRRWGGEVRLHAAQDNHAFLNAFDRLWHAMQREIRSPVRFKKVSVSLHSLRQKTEITDDLFSAANPVWQRRLNRHSSLSAAVDTLNAKYGAETIQLGVTPKTAAGYVGTKIAFSRVPDLAEFYE